MRKFFRIAAITLFSILTLTASSNAADETISITTYYPSPYGSYNDLYVANKLGVGTTSPGTYDGVVSKLEVKGTGGHTAITVNAPTDLVSSLVLAENDNSMWHLLSRGDSANRFELYAADGTSDGAKITVLQGGSVGIGTVTPQNKLDVEGGAVIGATYSGTNTAPSNGLLVEGNVGIGTAGPGQKLEVAGNFIVGTDNKIGFRYSPSDTNLYNYITGGGGTTPLTLVGGLETGGTTVEAIRFETATAGSAKMSILNNGNVGIGTASPSHKLHVYGDAGSSSWLSRFQNTNSGGASVYLSHSDGYGMHINPGTDAGSGTYALQVLTGTGGEALYVRGDGNVGIGTTDVLFYKLRVNGSTRINGAIYIDEISGGNTNVGVLSVRQLVQNPSMTTTDSPSAWLSSADGQLRRCTSSAKYKENIIDLAEVYPNALNLIHLLRPRHFRDKNSKAEHIGLIAEEVYEVIPELVTLREGEPEAVEYSHMVALLIEGVKEQQKQIEKQNKTIGQVKAENNELKEKLNSIEERVSVLGLKFRGHST